MHHPFQNEVQKIRKADHPIQSLILNRWSPRSMTGEAIPESELMALFEAARWAPSSYNNQPWRFLYARKDTPAWHLFFDLMIDFNKGWTKNASALILAVSAKQFEHNGKPCRTHSFDTGAAWMALAIEGAARGLVVHGMEGFDYEKARRDLEIPDDHQVEALIAVGKRAPAEKLPKELFDREKPSERNPVGAFASEGKFKKNSKVQAA
jgi:nitroreductase